MSAKLLVIRTFDKIITKYSLVEVLNPNQPDQTKVMVMGICTYEFD